MSLLALLIPAVMAVLLDLTLAPDLRLFGAHPSFSVALIAVWAIVRRRDEVVVMAPAVGLLLGILGNEPLGASVLGLTPVVLLAWPRHPESSKGRFSALLVTAFLGAAAYVLIVMLITALAARELPGPGDTIRIMGVAALLTTVFACMLYWPLARTSTNTRARGEFHRF